MTNPYDTLGVPKDATKEAIKRAYREKAQKVHPDKVGDSGKEAFQQVSKAYALLSDDTARARYDSTGKESPTEDNLPSELANLLVAALNRTHDVDCTDIVGVMRAELLGQRQHLTRQKSGVESTSRKFERAAARIKVKAGASNLLQSVLNNEALKGRQLLGQLDEAIKRNDALADMLNTYSYTVTKPQTGQWQSTTTFFTGI